MAARTRSVKGAKGGTVTVAATAGRSNSPAQARLMKRRMKGRR